jgi:hypothetical protein
MTGKTLTASWKEMTMRLTIERLEEKIAPAGMSLGGQ